jgi:hypothetical protein
MALASSGGAARQGATVVTAGDEFSFSLKGFRWSVVKGGALLRLVPFLSAAMTLNLQLRLMEVSCWR